MKTTKAAGRYDVLGNGYEVGTTFVGYGLSNAGRSYTVLGLGTKGRVRLVEHLTGRDFWTTDRYYRVAEGHTSAGLRTIEEKAQPEIRVDVRCGCGWGMMGCPESELPVTCPLCGHEFVCEGEV